MLNVFYDIPNSSPFTPYLGVGGGWTWDKYNVACTAAGGIPYCDAGASGERSFSTSGPSAQVMLGVNHQLSDRVSLGVEGRYFADFSPGKSNKFDGAEAKSTSILNIRRLISFFVCRSTFNKRIFPE